MAAVAPSCSSCSTPFASASSIPYRITSPSSSSPSRASPRLAPCRIRTPCLPELRRPPKCGRRTLGPMDRMECVEDKLVGGEVELADKNKNVAFDSSMRLAFAALAGMLVFQGSLQALASTELATLQPTDIVGDLGDINTGFASAFLLIFFSELGDRTFFIAALLAARNSGAVIFAGTFGALAVMTVVSVVLGRAFHYVDGIIPLRFGGTDFPVDDFAAACLLVYYGVTTLLDAASGDEEKINEEQEEAELAVSKFSGNGAGVMSAASTVASTFVLVFVAEWGDKSFLSTIALAAASSPLGVIAGSLAGHALATLIAVLGGSLLGTFLSEKIIAYIGGSLFLAFAAVTLVEIVT